mmetsp:Transcript_35847/g.100849  ORF Transcript_35847/g.100849 Transcript_35847/m.100849 type:complete len:202 (+) Transcript_35847:123-728(+)
MRCSAQHAVVQPTAVRNRAPQCIAPDLKSLLSDSCGCTRPSFRLAMAAASSSSRANWSSAAFSFATSVFLHFWLAFFRARFSRSFARFSVSSASASSGTIANSCDLSGCELSFSSVIKWRAMPPTQVHFPYRFPCPASRSEPRPCANVSACKTNVFSTAYVSTSCTSLSDTPPVMASADCLCSSRTSLSGMCQQWASFLLS